MRHVKVADNYGHADTQGPGASSGNGAFLLFALIFFACVFCAAFFGPAYIGQCASEGALADLCHAAELAFTTLRSFI